jgi:hypothetical protein
MSPVCKAQQGLSKKRRYCAMHLLHSSHAVQHVNCREEADTPHLTQFSVSLADALAVNLEGSWLSTEAQGAPHLQHEGGHDGAVDACAAMGSSSSSSSDAAL